MFPEVWLGGLSVPSYPAIILVGLLVCWLLIVRRGRRLGWDTPGLITVLLLGIPAGAIGGRALAALTEATLGSGATGYSGMTVIGSTAGVVMFAVLAAPRLVRARPLEFLDAVAFSMPLSFVFGRMGCLALGCCHGTPSPDGAGWATLPLATYAPGTLPRLQYDPLGVESIWNLPGLFVLQAVVGLLVVEAHYRRTRAWAPAGATAAMAAAVDAAGRLLIEPYRGGPWGEGANPWGTLTSIYLLVALMFLGMVWVPWWKERIRRARSGEA
jgi:prolipoprotein diacylglyceryltransferase